MCPMPKRQCLFNALPLTAAGLLAVRESYPDCHPMPRCCEQRPPELARTHNLPDEAVYRFLTSRMLPCHHQSGTAGFVLPTDRCGFGWISEDAL